MFTVHMGCLSLYLNIAGLQQGPRKMLLGPAKVLEVFETKSSVAMKTGDN